VARVEIDPGWREQVMAAWETFGDERLGPDIADDARRYCPVRTGALKASIEHHMEDEDIIVSASGGGEDSDGNLYVSRRPGRLSERTASLTHPDPGRNAGSLTTRAVHHVEDEGRTYALFVEMGHRVFHPSTRVTGPESVPPHSFLRPALYQERGD
jgi:hypothetical protein